MPILRTYTKERYTIIPNEILMSEELTLRDKGLLCYLLMLPDNWDFSLCGLLAVVKTDGRDALRKSLNNIEKAGYLKRERKRSDIGQLGESVWTVANSPVFLEQTPETDHATPISENPTLANHPQYKKESYTRKNNTSIRVALPEGVQRSGTGKSFRRKWDNVKRLQNIFGERRASNMIDFVHGYIKDLYPRYRGKSHKPESREKCAIFAEKLIDCANVLDLDDSYVRTAVKTALLEDSINDPQIYLVTSPHVLGYWINRLGDYSFDYIKGTDYDFNGPFIDVDALYETWDPYYYHQTLA